MRLPCPELGRTHHTVRCPGRSIMGRTQEQSAACLIAPHPQRRLDQQDASFSAAPAHGWRAADDHKPFHVAWLPQRQLWTLVGMVIQTRVAHAQEVPVVWLPFNGVARQGILPIFQCQRVLKNIDQRLFARQSLLAIEQEIPESGIACFRQGACLTDRLKGPVD